MSLVEAEAAGCKILTTDVGVASELNGATTCKVEDVTCLIDRIQLLLVKRDS